MGEEYAREEGMAVARFPADWSRYGKMAGPRRNGEMARYAMKKGCNGVLQDGWTRSRTCVEEYRQAEKVHICVQESYLYTDRWTVHVS